jgi:hypothetical protein
MHCNCTQLCYLRLVATRRRNLTLRAPAPPAGNDSQLVVRLPGALVRRVDQFAARMRAELPGTRFARAEAVRVLLTRALNRASVKAKA